MGDDLTLAEFLDRTPRLNAPGAAPAGQESAAQDEEFFCLDEVWENQRRENGQWVPAVERGRFSDRLGRCKFARACDVPTFGWRVVDDWSAGSWLYGKSFAQLEMHLAQGSSKVTDKGFSLVRWRAWVRQRASVPVTGESREVMAGWLGNKQRRGTWKSRFYVVGTSAPGASAAAPDVLDEDSSHDEGEPDDPDSEILPSAEPSHQRSLVAAEDHAPAAASAQQVSLVYFRRGFEDVRASFQAAMDFGDVLKLPLKMTKKLRLHPRCRVEAAQGHSTRFHLRFPSGYRKTFNAATTEQRDRWIEALSSLFYDHVVARRSSAMNIGDVMAAMKRGQSELRKGLMPWKRSSHIFHPPLPPAPSAPGLPVLTTELVKDATTGSIGVTLSEQQGGGVYVESIAPSAVELSTGIAPLLGPGDTILSVGGISLVGVTPGQAMPLIKEVLSSVPKGGSIVVEYQVARLTPTLRNRSGASSAAMTGVPSVSSSHLLGQRPSSSTQSSPEAQLRGGGGISQHFACELIRDKETGSLGITLKEPAQGGLLVDAVSAQASDPSGQPPGLAPGDIILSLCGENMQGLPNGTGIAKVREVLAKTPRDAVVVVEYASPSSRSIVSATEQSTRSILSTASQTHGVSSHDHELAQQAPSNSSVSSVERSRKPTRLNIIADLAVVGPAPPNDAGVTRDVAISVTLAELAKLVDGSDSRMFTYDQVRLAALKSMHLDLGAAADEVQWRIWFRSLLDVICDHHTLPDGAHVFRIVGMDPTTWTPWVRAEPCT